MILVMLNQRWMFKSAKYNKPRVNLYNKKSWQFNDSISVSLSLITSFDILGQVFITRAWLQKGTNCRLEAVRPPVSAGPHSVGLALLTPCYCLVHQAHIGLSGSMCNIDQQGSSLGSYPTMPSPSLHFNRPSGHWPCVKPCLVGGIGN